MIRGTARLALASMLLAGCGTAAVPAAADGGTADGTADGPVGTFVAEVWADNWFSLYIDGELVGEDSVPITTERSFNAESITFDATYPFTIAMVTKDFKEDDSGLEYIGTDRQQMGDGGFIVQITDTSTGDVVAASSSEWKALVVHRAPINKECERSASPATDCQHEIVAEPDGWQQPGFNDREWVNGTEHTAAAVGPKDGYDQVQWGPSAHLLWSEDLESDNTILWRFDLSAGI